MLLKRQISLFLAMILITQPMTILASENANSSDVLLSVTPQVFSAVVPTQLPVWMSASGVITTANDVNITNTSKGPIRVDNIELANVKANWELVNFDDDFSGFKVGSKKLAMSFNGDKSLANGSIVLGPVNLTPIDGLGSMQLDYDAKIPAQSTSLVDVVPANVVFTLGWDLSTGGSESGKISLTADKDVLAIDDISLLTVNQSTPSNITWDNSNPSVVVFEDVLTRSGGTQKVARAVALGKTTIKVTDEVGNIATKDIIVIENELVAIKITQMPNKTTYNIGEVFSPTGMKLKAAYKLGQEYDLRYYDYDETPIVVGQASVQISYEEKGTTKVVECPISVNSKPAEVETIVISTPPNKTAYIEGDNFDTTGMVVKANYDDGTEKVVTDYTLNNNLNLTSGQTEVNVNFNGKSATQAITVVAKTVTSITITTSPTKTAYIEGNNFDKAGMIVTAYYNNGTSNNISDYTVIDGTNFVVGQTSVGISYNGKSINQAITVVAKNLSNIAITTSPTKIAYIEGENFDAAGMIVTAYYDNDSTTVATPTLSRNTNLTTGQTSVDVSVGDKTIAQAITVAAKTLTGIEITTPPTKTAYVEGENFDAAGMVVTATYNNGTTSVITPTFGRNTNLTTGQTSVDVSFGGKTVTQDITVKIISVGDKYTEGNYEYSYGQGNYDETWVTASGQEGWGVKVINRTQADYLSPLTTIYGKPVTNMSYLFDRIGTPRTINLINWDTSNVTNMEGMFWNVMVDKINGLNNFDTSKVTNMNSMFHVAWVKSLDLSSFDTSNVTDFGNMFGSCRAENLDVSKFNTSKAINMSGMLGTEYATTLDVSKFDTSNVTNMSGMFDSSKGPSLDLSNFDTSKVVDMSQMFSNSSVTNLKGLNKFDTSKVVNMDYMFYNSKLSNLDLSNFNTENVTSMQFMFYEATFAKLNLVSFNTMKVTNMWGMFGKISINILDLSSFNMDNSPNSNFMFDQSTIKTLIVRNQFDADYYKSSWSLPESTIITIKA